MCFFFLTMTMRMEIVVLVFNYGIIHLFLMNSVEEQSRFLNQHMVT